jgi:gas vesicle protein
MRYRSFLSGLVIGALLGAGAMFVFGDRIRGSVAGTTKEIGHSVEKAGETIEKESGKLH